MNMPGFSAPAVLGKVAITATARVTGSTRESMLVTLPANCRSGYTVVTAEIGMPMRTVSMNVSGIENPSLIVLTSSSVVMTVSGLTRSPRLILRRPTTPAKGARTDSVSSRACAPRTWALATARLASSCSRSAAETACVAASAWLRRYWLSACLSWASARLRLAASCRVSSSTSTWPARTCWPSRKSIRVTTLLDRTVISMDSFACAVPSAA